MTQNQYFVAYARFSPRPDAAECESTERQLADIKSWARAQGWVLRARKNAPCEFRDDAESGDDAERPGLWAAIDALRRGDVLVVRSMDRLARSTGLTEALLLKIAAAGATLASVDGVAAVGENRYQRFLRRILQAHAELQLEEIRERTSRRMRQHQANGRLMSKEPPYGFREGEPRIVTLADGSTRTERTLEPDPSEQAIAERIAEMRADGLSYHRIAETLNTDGVPARGRRWWQESVKRVCQRTRLLAV